MAAVDDTGSFGGMVSGWRENEIVVESEGSIYERG